MDKLLLFKKAAGCVGVAYLVLFLLAGNLVDLGLIADRFKIRDLNDTQPGMQRLVDLEKQGVLLSETEWSPYLKYFTLVVRYIEGEPVSRMFLGICKYHLNDKASAGKYLFSAAEVPPPFFWSLYNAGVFAFEQGQMDLAAKYLERAFTLPHEVSFRVIQGSVVYRQMMAASNFDLDIPGRMLEARENVHFLLAAASFYAKDYPKARAIAFAAIKSPDIKDKEPFYFISGAASMVMGELKDALALLEKCIELKSQNPFAYKYAGEILLRFGQTDTGNNMLKASRALQQRRPDMFPYPERLKLRFL